MLVRRLARVRPPAILYRPLAPALSCSLCTGSAQQRKPQRQPRLSQLGPDATPLQLAGEIEERFAQRQWPSRLMLDRLAGEVQTEAEARELYAQHQNYVYHMQTIFPLTSVEALLQAYYRGSLDTLFEVLAAPKRLRIFYQDSRDIEILPLLVPELICKLAADGELERVEQLYRMLPKIAVQLYAAANDGLVRSLVAAGHAEAAELVVSIATAEQRPLGCEFEALLSGAEGSAAGEPGAATEAPEEDAEAASQAEVSPKPVAEAAPADGPK